MKDILPAGMTVLRGQTQKNVNKKILAYLYNQFQGEAEMSMLDLPCGNLEFLTYVRRLFKRAKLHGADIVAPNYELDISFYQMDLTRDFILPPGLKFDIVTSISGVMMFSNTLNFINNCSARLNDKGLFILTNDNNATIKDRLAFLFLGRYRIFNLIFEDDQPMTENVPVNELVRIIRNNGIEIESITYTSLYWKDLIFLPVAVVAYAFQWLYLKNNQTSLPEKLIGEMYPFKHMFCRHYIIRGFKQSGN